MTEDNNGAVAPKLGHGRRLFLAKPALAAALAEVDARAEFASDPEGHEEARILAKLEAYRAWLVAHDLRPPRNGQNPAVVGVLKAIGHYHWRASGVVRSTIVALGDLLREGDAFRHRPERYSDIALDAYSERVANRGYGLPRRQDDGGICWPSTADDAKIPVHSLDAITINRLRAIDMTVKAPGRTVNPAEPPLLIDGRTPPNPAARMLIDKAAERMKQGVVEDPLAPGHPLVAEFAEQAGISPIDIMYSPSNAAVMADIVARSGVIPHPIIQERLYSYRDLKQFGRKLRRAECAHRADPGAAARDTVGALSRFIEKIGGEESQQVPADFPSRVAEAITEHEGDFGSGWKADMERWIKWNDALRADRPLPELFGPALRILMAEVGMTLADLGREFGSTAVKWVDGATVPSHKADAMFQRLAKRLRVPVETLASQLSSEWRRHLVDRPDDRIRRVSRTLPDGYREMTDEQRKELLETRFAESARQPTEWARKVSQAFRDEYRLRRAEWLSPMEEAFDSVMPDPKGGRARMRRPGERTSPDHREAQSRAPWRTPTREWAESLFGYTLGFLARPAGEGGPRDVDDIAPEEAEEGGGAFRAEPGLGIPRELLHPALFALVDLVTLYAWWNRSRNGGTVSPIMIETVRYIMDLLRPKTGYVWKNPQFIRQMEDFIDWWDENPPVTLGGGALFDIEPFREDWQKAVGEAYAQLSLDLKDFRANKVRKLRDPFAPIMVFLDDKSTAGPLGLYMIGVRNLLAARPSSTMSRHVHTRNCILTLILVQTALRARNLLLTYGGENSTLRREISEDGATLWRIVIPGEEFKNYRSPHFGSGRNFDFVLEDEDGLYDLLDRYTEKGRPYLLSGRESDAFFVTSRGNDFTVPKVTETYHRITAEHFVYNERTKRGIKGAMMHGVHAVRHVVATHLVRTEGDLYLAAWALQDSLRTVDRHYARFLPGDRLRLAAKVLKNARLGIQTQRTDVEVAATVARAANSATGGKQRAHCAA